MVGRIEAYLHSDSVTQNKGGSLVKIVCQTDFAAQTEEFMHFTKLIAKLAYGYQITDPQEFLEIEGIKEEIKEIESKIKEKINIEEIKILNIKEKENVQTRRTTSKKT